MRKSFAMPGRPASSAIFSSQFAVWALGLRNDLCLQRARILRELVTLLAEVEQAQAPLHHLTHRTDHFR
jgi:hypothetical protein